MRLPMLASMLLLGALSAGLQSVPGASTAAAVLPSPKPNFVVIFLDDMRADQQSALPYTRAAIGGQGATFDNAYAPYPLCCPARATILSGQYPHNNHVFGNVPPYGGVAAFDDSNTIATWMKGAGYKTPTSASTSTATGRPRLPRTVRRAGPSGTCWPGACTTTAASR